MQENNHVAVAEKAQKNNHLAKALAAGTATALVLVTNSANAADIPLSVPDMAPILGLIMGIVAIVASIGMAVLSVYATGKVFKWVKAAF